MADENSEIFVSTRAATEHEIPHSSEGKAPSDVNSDGNLGEYEFYLQKAIEPPHWAVSANTGVKTNPHARSFNRSEQKT
jgi:hypothetical protein